MRTRYLAVFPLVALAACSQPNRGGEEFMSGQNGIGVGAGSSAAQTAATQGPNPTSPAFFSQSVGDRVLFDVDQFTLNASGKAALDVQARWLIDNPSYSIIVEGHADEQGTREYNLALGSRRATSVQEYLVSRGVSPLRLKTRSFGKERPVEICSTEDCYSKNRRAVTVLVAGLG